MSVLVVGSVALDSVKTPFGEKEEVLGGSATYFAISASFFTKVNMVAVVGTDFPKEHLRVLEAKGVDVKGLQIKSGKTFRWKGEYEYDLNNAKTIYTHLNVFSAFNPHIPEEYKESRYVFLANIDPAIQAVVLDQVEKATLVACDSMNYWIEHQRRELTKLLKRVNVFMVNDAEAREFSRQSNLIKAAKSILALGPKIVVIKKGEHGAVLFSGNSIFSVPAYLLESVYDPTGAGDTFAGGFIGYLAQSNNMSERNIRKAIIYGSVMASYVVEDFGPSRLSRLTREDIEARFEEFKQLMYF